MLETTLIFYVLYVFIHIQCTSNCLQNHQQIKTPKDLYPQEFY